MICVVCCVPARRNASVTLKMSVDARQSRQFSLQWQSHNVRSRGVTAGAAGALSEDFT